MEVSRILITAEHSDMYKKAILDATKEDVSHNVAEPTRTITGSPIGLAAGIGLLGAGAGMLGWNAAVNTTRSLGRLPARKLFGMSNQEWDATMDDALDHKSYRYIVPAAAGLLAAGGILAANFNPREEGYGLTSWYPEVKTAGLQKAAAFQKFAVDMEYNGYISNIDYSQPVNIMAAKDMFDNNPHLRDYPYTVWSGDAILNRTANQTGLLNPTAGQLNSTALDHFMNKFTWAGIADIGIKTALANKAAEMFTDVVSTVSNMEPDTRRNIIDGTTLATALISILK